MKKQKRTNFHKLPLPLPPACPCLRAMPCLGHDSTSVPSLLHPVSPSLLGLLIGINTHSNFLLFKNKLSCPHTCSTTARFSASITAKLIEKEVPVARPPSFSYPVASPQAAAPSCLKHTGLHSLLVSSFLAGSFWSPLQVPSVFPGLCNTGMSLADPSPFLCLNSLPPSVISARPVTLSPNYMC